MCVFVGVWVCLSVCAVTVMCLYLSRAFECCRPLLPLLIHSLHHLHFVDSITDLYPYLPSPSKSEAEDFERFAQESLCMPDTGARAMKRKASTGAVGTETPGVSSSSSSPSSSSSSSSSSSTVGNRTSPRKHKTPKTDAETAVSVQQEEDTFDDLFADKPRSASLRLTSAGDVSVESASKQAKAKAKQEQEEMLARATERLLQGFHLNMKPSGMGEAEPEDLEEDPLRIACSATTLDGVHDPIVLAMYELMVKPSGMTRLQADSGYMLPLVHYFVHYLQLLFIKIPAMYENGYLDMEAKAPHWRTSAGRMPPGWWSKAVIVETDDLKTIKKCWRLLSAVVWGYKRAKEGMEVNMCPYVVVYVSIMYRLCAHNVLFMCPYCATYMCP